MPPPTKPSGVSGPGKFSKRTDGGPAQKLQALPDAKYGENKAYMSAQRGAPMSQTPNQPAAPTPGGGPPFQDNPSAGAVVPLSTPSQRPGEPVTAGAALGAGPGVEALGIQPKQIEQQDVSQLQNWVSAVEYMSNLPDALPGARMLVNSLKAHIPQ